MGECRINESVGVAVDLALGERPQLDDLHPARQRVGELAQCQYLRRSGEQEPAWLRVGVHRHFDGAEELRRQLNFVDHKEAIVIDETRGIIPGRAQRCRVIQQADQRVRAGLGGEPGERALTSLPGTVQRNNPGVT